MSMGVVWPVVRRMVWVDWRHNRMRGVIGMYRRANCNRWHVNMIRHHNIQDLDISVNIQELCRLQSQAIGKGRKVSTVEGDLESTWSCIDRHAEVLSRMKRHSSVSFLIAPGVVRSVVADNRMLLGTDTHVEWGVARSTCRVLNIQVESASNYYLNVIFILKIYRSLTVPRHDSGCHRSEEKLPE